MRKTRLSNRELDLLKVLWESDEPLTVSQICQKSSQLTIKTVQKAAGSLLKKGVIQPDNNEPQRYRPRQTASEYCAEELENLFPRVENFAMDNYAASFLGRSSDKTLLLDEMELLLKERREASADGVK